MGLLTPDDGLIKLRQEYEKSMIDAQSNGDTLPKFEDWLKIRLQPTTLPIQTVGLLGR